MHASSSIAEAASPQMYVTYTRQFLHLAIAHMAPIRSEEVEVYNGPLGLGVLIFSEGVEDTNLVTIAMSKTS